jgi:fibronectin-binding autotransporter adhesin
MTNVNSLTVDGTLSTTGAGLVSFNAGVAFGTKGQLDVGIGGVTFASTSSQIFMFNGLVLNGPLTINSSAGNIINTTTSGTGAINMAFTGSTTLAGNGTLPNFGGQIESTGSTTGAVGTTGTIGASVINSNINLNSNNVAFTPGVITGTSSATIGSFVDIIGPAANGFGTPGVMTINGTITGNSDLIIAGNATVGGGAGSLLLNAANTYTGNTFMAQTSGTTTIGVTNALPVGTNLLFNVLESGTATTLQLNGLNQQVASISTGTNGGGIGFASFSKTIITNSNASASTLTINGSVSPGRAYAGMITGNINIVKSGNNLITLAGTNTYSGTTTINGGGLFLTNANGYLSSNNNTVNVNTTGTLGGNAGINGSVVLANGATITGSQSAAGSRLTLGNGLDLSAGGTFLWNLYNDKAIGGTSNPTGTAGKDYDQIVLNGGELVSGGNGLLTLNFSQNSADTGGPNGADADTFWSGDHSWIIVNDIGGSTDGDPLTLTTSSYTDGSFATSIDGFGDEVLNYYPTPEPGTWVMALGGIGMLLGFQRSRRRR